MHPGVRGVHFTLSGVHLRRVGCNRKINCSGKLKLDTKGCIIGQAMYNHGQMDT